MILESMDSALYITNFTPPCPSLRLEQSTIALYNVK